MVVVDRLSESTDGKDYGREREGQRVREERRRNTNASSAAERSKTNNKKEIYIGELIDWMKWRRGC